jgi:hypothetical protein
MEKHTFVICAYKESSFLESCILSCVEQKSFKSKLSKIILYTSTPNEYISNLCKKYKIILYTSEGGGIGKDWNNALACVKTKYATIVHQDDIYLPDYGERLLSLFSKNEKLNIAFSDYEEIDALGTLRRRSINLKIKTLGLKMLSLWGNKSYQRRIYSFGNFICCPAVSYNLERLSSFKFSESMKMAVDWDAWERIMKLEGNIYFEKQILMYHRIHQESETTVNTANHNRESEEFEMYQRYWGKRIAKILMTFYVNNQRSNS